jgi:hypothetical protein
MNTTQISQPATDLLKAIKAERVRLYFDVTSAAYWTAIEELKAAGAIRFTRYHSWEAA